MRSAGLMLGVGTGGLIDGGIVAHQLLEWHHLLSSWFPQIHAQDARINMVTACYISAA